MNTFSCPHCGKEVEISQALEHRIKEDVLKDVEGKHKEELSKITLDIEEKTKLRLKEEMEFKFKDSVNELEESKKRNRELQEQLLEMNKTLREFKEMSERREIDTQRRLAEEMDKAREGIMKTEQEKASIEILQLRKKLEDTEKSLGDAQRKAQQSSQQLQGEVLELDLEAQIRENFPTDDVVPVPKGVEGADVIQQVRNNRGQTAGSILWEFKRTKAFSNGWLAKLREDERRVGASTSILVTETLPEHIKTFGLHENVWVTCYEYAISLAGVLRISLMKIAIAKSSAANKEERLEQLYNYITDDAFRHRFEAQVESIKELKEDLNSEQRSMERIWKKREMQINRMQSNVSKLYGELQGIVHLPTLPSLEMGFEPLVAGAQRELLD